MSSVLPTVLAKTIAHVPLEAVLASRPAYGWRLDAAAFTAAVGGIAPTVPVIDVTAVAMHQTRIGA
ncbi:hypothetical protein R8Z50_34785 [Longispora sp. K20-0274]|uniref:hypothetical protein n=1 Tax=Longispora sp. K20-0274 TaxID=3088255 RepID=UPI00399ADF42